MGVRGTVFGTEIKKDGKTIVSVLSGKVEVKLKSNNDTYMITSYKKFVLNNDGVTHSFKKLNSKDLEDLMDIKLAKYSVKIIK